MLENRLITNKTIPTFIAAYPQPKPQTKVVAIIVGIAIVAVVSTLIYRNYAKNRSTQDNRHS
ncbi:hypothetical protein [Brumimicrobium mesophilum]|uniref:hypothetical protein n=1 Tax=Brumimicrobium mesophilum TaxID=392717 RepID=UPI000D13F5D6|nr:hypothetical protein [Brumimicrobium mesophilum]